MTNKELLLKMKVELENYQIGLHHMSLESYQDVIKYAHWKKFKYQIDGDVTEESLAKHIIKDGLNVSDIPFGLRSTVSFFEKITSDTFNYNYHSDEGTIWVIIIATPYFINYNGRPYFVGNLTYSVNVGNMILFNYKLPSEFIYGYYTKNVLETIVGQDGFKTHRYDDKLTFYENPDFWMRLDSDTQDDVMNKIFNSRKRSLSALKLANNHSRLRLIFNPDKFIIKSTREQHKKLGYNLSIF